MKELDLGFVGLGRMGTPMATHLLDAGHRLVIFDPAPGAGDALVSRGARRATSAAEVAMAVDTVFISLPTPDIVEKVVLGPAGLRTGNRVRTIIDLSTTGPRMAATVAAALAPEQRITFVDAPVSGGVTGAQKGTLAVMVSCPRPTFDALSPVLEKFGKLFFIGEQPGMAQTMKLVNNLLAATAQAITSEGFVMGVKAGLDPNVMVDVINVSSGRNSATMDKFPRSVLPRTFDFGFATGLSYKDVRLCVDEAEAMGVPMVVGGAVRQFLAMANAAFGPTSDFTSMVKLVEQWAGVEVDGRR